MNTAYNKYRIAKMERNEIISSMIWGFIIGVVCAIAIELFAYGRHGVDISSAVGIVLTFGCAFMGLPYMWGKLPSLSSFGLLGVILLIIKFGVASIIGIVVTPLMLIIKIIQTASYKHQSKSDWVSSVIQSNAL